MAEWLSGERRHTAKHDDVSCLVSAYVVGVVNHTFVTYIFIYLVEKGKGHEAK